MNTEARGSVVGWGALLQAGRSPVRVPDEVDFSIYLILPAAIWPWGLLSLQQKLVPGIFLGVKSGRRVGLTNLPPSVSRMSENVGASTSRNPKGLHRDNFTFTYDYNFKIAKYINSQKSLLGYEVHKSRRSSEALLAMSHTRCNNSRHELLSMFIWLSWHVGYTLCALMIRCHFLLTTTAKVML
jgi:hypothetical protein